MTNPLRCDLFASMGGWSIFFSFFCDPRVRGSLGDDPLPQLPQKGIFPKFLVCNLEDAQGTFFNHAHGEGRFIAHRRSSGAGRGRHALAAVA